MSRRSSRLWTPSRRGLIQGMGAAGLGVAGLRSRPLAASEGEAPKRLLIISHCHGWPYDSWKLRPEGVTEGTATEVDLVDLDEAEWSQPLAPLYAHRDRMIAIDGLSLLTAELDVDGNRHDTGWVHAWTGGWADFSGSDTRSTAPSIDQLVAAQVAPLDRLPSLELAINASGETGRPISYAASGARLPVSNTPALAWQRLFGLTANADPLVLRQRDALTWATEQYRSSAAGLGVDARDRLAAQRTLVEGLADRIEGLAGLECGELPELPGELEAFDDSFDACSELVAAAFACDVTRVATLSMGEMPTSDFGWDHVTDDVHKGLAHNIYDDADAHQAMTDYLERHAGQVARLLDLLAATPDVDGRSLLDNTLVVWGSELADGWHGYRHWNPVLFGGSWAFRQGVYHYWPHETPSSVLVPSSVDSSGYVDLCGRPHQRLLVSIAQAMGVDVDAVGIETVQGQAGDWIDCRDPLDELS